MALEAFAKDIRIGGGIGCGFLLHTRGHIEFVHTVIAIIRQLGGGIALALHGHGMDQHRPRCARLGAAQHVQELGHVMTIDRTDIGKAQMLEQCRGFLVAGDQFARTLRALAQRFGQVGGNAIGDILECGQGRVLGQAR